MPKEFVSKKRSSTVSWYICWTDCNIIAIKQCGENHQLGCRPQTLTPAFPTRFIPFWSLFGWLIRSSDSYLCPSSELHLFTYLFAQGPTSSSLTRLLSGSARILWRTRCLTATDWALHMLGTWATRFHPIQRWLFQKHIWPINNNKVNGLLKGLPIDFLKQISSPAACGIYIVLLLLTPKPWTIFWEKKP